ncbi:MAG: DUF1573 domain-containing protein [Spirochaetales bacterium]|nr:DUF1573 domain-containing protein [Spirochaetales bacterium]
MKNKIWQGVIIFFLVIMGCRVPDGIRFEKAVHDFGEVEEGTDVRHSYVFENTGTGTLTIEYVQPSCVCMSALGWDRTVKPGEKGEISVLFKTPRFNGDVTKTVFVRTDLPPPFDEVRLELKGKVVIPIEIVPLNTWLGEVDGDTPFLDGNFDIKNNSRESLSILDVVPPRNVHITYRLVTVCEGRRYKLFYTIYPPFSGRGTVEMRFTLETDNALHHYIYPTFFYHIPSDVTLKN